VFDALSRNGALQTRDRYKLGTSNGPGSAVHRFALKRFTLHRIRDTEPGVNDGRRKD
jgi:hypothetical protein